MSRELSFERQESLPAVPVGSWIVPAVVAASGDDVANRFIEFFVVAIRNANTRRSYATVICQFCAWLEKHGAGDLTVVQPVHVATYTKRLMS